MNLIISLLSLIAILGGFPALAQDAAKSTMPRFRSSDSDAPTITAPITMSPIRLMADPDFAPWSFTAEDGTLTGISVELAKATCIEAGLICSVIAAPQGEVFNRLSAAQGEAIITGMKLDDQLLAKFIPTKPYFRSMGRFLMIKGTELADVDPRSLAGRRVGVVKNTAHHVFLSQHYSRSALVIFDNTAALLEALRGKQLDAAFADAIALAFWAASVPSQGCCVPLGGAMLDDTTFSRPLVFLTRPDLSALRDRFDEALDQLESKGTTATIFNRFLPAPIW